MFRIWAEPNNCMTKFPCHICGELYEAGAGIVKIAGEHDPAGGRELEVGYCCWYGGPAGAAERLRARGEYATATLVEMITPWAWLNAVSLAQMAYRPEYDQSEVFRDAINAAMAADLARAEPKPREHMYLELRPNRIIVSAPCAICGAENHPHADGGPEPVLITKDGLEAGIVCLDCISAGSPEGIANPQGAADRALKRAAELHTEAARLEALAPAICEIPPSDWITHEHYLDLMDFDNAIARGDIHF